MSPASVLLLSSLYDFSTDLICIELEKAGVSYFRLNREQLTQHGISFNPLSRILRVRSKDIDITIGPELKAVVFRQPVFLRNTPAQPLELEKQMERSQWAAFLRALSVFSEAIWLNWPQATYLAESKPYQLHLAKELGFNVPSTIVTNDMGNLPKFTAEKIILKSLDTALFFERDDCFFTYTTIADASSLATRDASTAPIILQDELQPKTDLRVTIIGNELFTVEILSNGKGVAGDWRTEPRELLEYRDVELPSDVEKLCREMVKRLNLNFGAIDLIESIGAYYFIEINPTGEWAWLQSASRDIAGAFVRVLRL